MISASFAGLMARYNRWQNENLYAAAERLSDQARRDDQGAFFGSIHGTLSHLAWADATWLSRLADWPEPTHSQRDSGGFVAEWDALRRLRAALDTAILVWADALTPEALASELRWHSRSVGREMTKPLDEVVVHVFNHQTHHRGQVHAMLTRCGVTPGDTDLFLMARQSTLSIEPDPFDDATAPVT